MHPIRKMPTPTTCLSLFPEEVWEMILDRIEDSKDIQNALVAFPELDELLHGRKTCWLIDQVFSYIFKQFLGGSHQYYTRNLLRCRVVCKRWGNAVQSFLKNHPSRHPYNPNGPNRRTVTYGQFNYIEERIKLVQLEGTESIQRFHNKIMDHPRNPFLLRKLTLSNPYAKSYNSHEFFLNACISLLEKFGHYISHLEFIISDRRLREWNDQQVESVFKKICKCLSHTPNVQHLKLDLTFNHSFDSEIPNFYISDFTKVVRSLTHLETLLIPDWGCDSSIYLSNAFLIDDFTKMVKKIWIPINSDLFFGEITFENLVELCVETTSDSHVDFDTLTFLDHSNFPSLRKLSFCSNRSTVISINDLFRVLEKLNVEEVLLLVGFKIEGDPNSNLSALPTIKYFQIMDDIDHEFEFLKLFTSLEHLHLRYNNWKCLNPDNVEIIKSHIKDMPDFSSELRKYMYEPVVPENANIWEALPTLKILTVENYHGIIQYSREGGNKSFAIKWNLNNETVTDLNDSGDSESDGEDDDDLHGAENENHELGDIAN